jgi:hypothetical protein
MVKAAAPVGLIVSRPLILFAVRSELLGCSLRSKPRGALAPVDSLAFRAPQVILHFL